jgi:hypothetical protein
MTGKFIGNSCWIPDIPSGNANTVSRDRIPSVRDSRLGDSRHMYPQPLITEILQDRIVGNEVSVQPGEKPLSPIVIAGNPDRAIGHRMDQDAELKPTLRVRDT